MVRSAAAVLLAAILPALVVAQEVSNTHTVVGGDTLWDLAQRYYGDPFEWRAIWDANRSQVEDPNLILPGQVLVIPPPGGRAAVTEVAVQPPARPGPRPPQPEPAPGMERTIFYQDTARMRAGVVRAEDLEYVAVPRDLVYSAPWLIGLEGEPQSIGRVVGFAGGEARSETPRSYNRVSLTVRPGAVRVGDQLRLYRVTRTIDDVGQVVTPTGLVTLTDVAGDEAIGLVTKEYHRISLRDYAGPLPDYRIRMGQYAEPVDSDQRAMVVGFAGGNVVPDIGSVAFLDVGSDDGVAVGDEFEYLNPLAGAEVVEGRVQVVGVLPDRAAARIIGMADAVFRPGIALRLARKMR